jgi:hypothetical protein
MAVQGLSVHASPPSLQSETWNAENTCALIIGIMERDDPAMPPVQRRTL